MLWPKGRAGQMGLSHRKARFSSLGGGTDGRDFQNHPSADEWINKRLCARTIEYYTAFKRKEALTHATMWMTPEDIMLNEINQTQKDKSCRIPLT